MNESDLWINYEIEKRKIYEQYGYTAEADQKIKELLKEWNL